jgi:hypothetical protein
MNGAFLNDVHAQTCSNNLPVSSVSANGNDGNVPQNVLDNNLNTRWSNLGIGSWILMDLGSTDTICSVDIAWFSGIKELVILSLPHLPMDLPFQQFLVEQAAAPH